MPSDILFSEKQRFTQWWLWLLLIGLGGLMLYGIIQQVIFGIPFGSKPASDAGLLLSSLIPFSLIALFLSFRLETQIAREGIYVRFLPFHKTFKYYPWESILRSYVRKYSPILEYGGWGLRYGFISFDGAYNVSGNKGLQLEFNDHKKLLIGTQKPEAITETLRKLGKIKE